MKKKRTFFEIRINLLRVLSKKELTINRLAKLAKVNWRTTELQLTYLIGKGFVKEVLCTPYVRIYGITERGKQFLKDVKR